MSNATRKPQIHSPSFKQTVADLRRNPPAIAWPSAAPKPVSRAATKRFQHLAEARLALDWEPAQLVILALVSNTLTRVDLDTRALAASPAPSSADAARLRIAIRADETVAMRGLTKLGLLMDQSNLRTSFARARTARDITAQLDAAEAAAPGKPRLIA